MKFLLTYNIAKTSNLLFFFTLTCFKRKLNDASNQKAIKSILKIISEIIFDNEIKTVHASNI